MADNGGPTLTHLPQDGSPLINAGDNASCLSTDQRGQARSDGSCDIGAVEIVDPLAVGLGHINSERADDTTVTFTWETATETGNTGFNFYMETGDALSLVNLELIPSRVIDSTDNVAYLALCSCVI